MDGAHPVRAGDVGVGVQRGSLGRLIFLTVNSLPLPLHLRTASTVCTETVRTTEQALAASSRLSPTPSVV